MNLTNEFLEATKPELTALCAFASKDETRPHLASICIDRAKGLVCATDGHRLLVWRGECLGDAPQVLVPAARIAKLLSWKLNPAAGFASKRRVRLVPGLFRLALGPSKVTVATIGAEVSLAQTTGVQYPPVEQVLPKRGDADPVACVGFQPRLLADLLPLIGHRGGVVFQPGTGELDPILVKLEVPGWMCVLMPYRASGTYPAAQPEGRRK